VIFAEMLYEVGPLATAVDATGWQFYQSGISNDPYCNRTVNCGVNIVRYGSENGTD